MSVANPGRAALARTFPRRIAAKRNLVETVDISRVNRGMLEHQRADRNRAEGGLETHQRSPLSATGPMKASDSDDSRPLRSRHAGEVWPPPKKVATLSDVGRKSGLRGSRKNGSCDTLSLWRTLVTSMGSEQVAARIPDGLGAVVMRRFNAERERWSWNDL